MEGSYDPVLVILSYVVAVAASYTALYLTRRVFLTRGSYAALWLVGGAFSMGVGVWTMHFIGMLAFSMPMPFTFDLGMTLLSLLVGIAAAAFALFVASRRRNSLLRLSASGLVLGAGIAAMHYTGMAAMRMNATLSYDPLLLTLSVVIAVAAACAALAIIASLSRRRDEQLPLIKLGAAALMGVAICGMHYTGMEAMIVTPFDGEPVAAGDRDNLWLAMTLAGVAVLILGVTHLTIFFDYRLTAERRKRDTARQEAVRLSELLDESTNEIYVIDSETLRFVKANRGAINNLGYSEEELRELTPPDIDRHHKERTFRALLEPLRDGAKPDLMYDTTHRRRDGSEYPVQVHLHLSGVTDPPVFVATVTDVSERRDLERQLVQAQKMESIGQLAAGIAHEINTPAQFVGDNTRFLKDAFADLLSVNACYGRLYDAARNDAVTPALLAEVAAAVEAADPAYLIEEVPLAIDQALEGVSRISSIVRAMKEFSHPGSRERESVDLNKAIENTVTVTSNEWKYVAEVRTRLMEDLPPVDGYGQEINQVLLNLVVNAAHAIAQSLGENSEEKGTITLSTRRVGEEAEITVSDSGCGIPAAIRERIFEPFFTTKEVGRGSGQGLALVYRTIVEKHGGKIDVHSTVGKGTTFALRLPLHVPDAGRVSAAA